MKDLVLRSIIVALTVSTLCYLAFGLLIGRAYVWDEPIDHATLSSMSYDDAVTYQGARSRQITGWGYIWHSITGPGILRSTLEQFAWSFVPLLLGCMWMGLWQRRLPTDKKRAG
jgi:hypothetical protein